MSTPSPIEDVRSISQIYKSGDLMLENPAEAGIIFVSVILVSAFLEWVLQKASTLDNKYARMMVETMSQEVTIVGVLALVLMFGTSVIPSGFVQTKYVTLFTWANMCLFFMAFFFVATVIGLFMWAGWAVGHWRTFEEGLMDTMEEEVMKFDQVMYKRATEVYTKVLKKECGMSSNDVPFFEVINVTVRKQLVRMSNLSYRTWFCLSLVVLLNLVRAKATPFLKSSDDTTFGNALLFIGAIGWGILSAFILFYTIMRHRLQKYLSGGYSSSEAPNANLLIPLGSSKRALEFIQVILMCINWYITLFVTGLGSEASQLTGWQLSTIVITFWLPILVIAFLLPWSIMSISILLSLGGINKPDMERIHRQVKGELAESDEDDSESDDEDDRSQSHNSLTRKSSASSMTGTKGPAQSEARPVWLDNEDDWDGKRTQAKSSAGAGGTRARFSHLYHENVDHQKLHQHIFQDGHREGGGGQRAHVNRDEQGGGHGTADTTAEGAKKKRAAWLDPDEEDRFQGGPDL